MAAGFEKRYVEFTRTRVQTSVCILNRIFLAEILEVSRQRIEEEYEVSQARCNTETTQHQNRKRKINCSKEGETHKCLFFLSSPPILVMRQVKKHLRLMWQLFKIRLIQVFVIYSSPCFFLTENTIDLCQRVIMKDRVDIWQITSEMKVYQAICNFTA